MPFSSPARIYSCSIEVRLEIPTAICGRTEETSITDSRYALMENSNARRYKSRAIAPERAWVPGAGAGAEARSGRPERGAGTEARRGRPEQGPERKLETDARSRGRSGAGAAEFAARRLLSVSGNLCYTITKTWGAGLSAAGTHPDASGTCRNIRAHTEHAGHIRTDVAGTCRNTAGAQAGAQPLHGRGASEARPRSSRGAAARAEEPCRTKIPMARTACRRPSRAG
jgi:hypothetical protein